MKRTYLQPRSDPVEMFTEYVLMSSDYSGSGSDLEEPYEMTDTDFTTIFG